MIPRPPISARTDTLVPYTTLFRSQRLQIRDALARHRAADLVGIDIDAGKRQGTVETLERVEHALAGLSRLAQIGQRRAVGRDLFRALIAEETAPRGLRAAKRDHRTDAGKTVGIRCCTGNSGSHTQ